MDGHGLTKRGEGGGELLLGLRTYEEVATRELPWVPEPKNSKKNFLSFKFEALVPRVLENLKSYPVPESDS